MAEYSRLAKGSFTAANANAVVTLPFVPDYVELWNLTNIKASPTNHKVCRAWWDNNLLDAASPKNNPTMIELYNATPVVVFDTILANGITSFQGALSLQYGAVYQHTGSTDFQINKANPAQVTTTTNHNLNTGDVVVFSNLFQTSTTGMEQLSNIPFMVTRTGATTFTINWNTSQSQYTAFNTASSTNGVANNVGSFKKVLYPQLYLPQDDVISAITTGATTTISTAMQHGFQVGQEVAFRIPSAWGTTQLNSLPNSVIPGSPIYGYVVSVTDLQNFVVSINSSSYTAYSSNQTIASVSGLSYPQVVPVGDVNTGGVPISAGSALYPSPQWSYASFNDSSTINGPAIRGAFVNNTNQGFLIGVGTGNTDSSAQLLTSGDIVLWHAYAHDLGSP